MKLDLVGVDTGKCDEGVWRDFTDLSGNKWRFKIASIQSPAYANCYADLHTKALDGKPRGTEIATETLRDMRIKSVAYSLVTDWALTSGGEPVKFDKETCYEVLSDRRYAELFNWIVDEATRLANFAEEQEAEDLKKSKRG